MRFPIRHRQLFSLLLLLASTQTLAVPAPEPTHSLSPTLNGLNISTMVKKDRVKIMIYVVNHEPFPVLCDAQYRSGQEKLDVPEITFPAGKADVFRFAYGRRGDHVVLRLICIDPGKDALTEESSDESF